MLELCECRLTTAEPESGAVNVRRRSLAQAELLPREPRTAPPAQARGARTQSGGGLWTRKFLMPSRLSGESVEDLRHVSLIHA